MSLAIQPADANAFSFVREARQLRAPIAWPAGPGRSRAHYRKRCATTLADQRSLDEELGFLNGNESEAEFRSFYARFYEYIADELERTEARFMEDRRPAS